MRKSKIVLMTPFLLALAVLALPASALSLSDFFPSAAFISTTSSFSYDKSITTSERCSNPAYVGVNNPTGVAVDSASVTITITNVDNPINNIHVGKTRSADAQVLQATDCDVYNSACTGSPVTAFKSPAWSDLGTSIDGTCSYVFGVHFVQPTQTNTITGTVTGGTQTGITPTLQPEERVPVLSDLVDLLSIVLMQINGFVSRLW